MTSEAFARVGTLRFADPTWLTEWRAHTDSRSAPRI